MMSEHVNIAVTGGRDYQDQDRVWTQLDLELVQTSKFRLHVGDANGVDKFARQWALERGIPYTIYYANWNKYGRAAGPIRNREMMVHADKLLAFPGGRGTEDAIAAARHMGIEVVRV